MNGLDHKNFINQLLLVQLHLFIILLRFLHCYRTHPALVLGLFCILAYTSLYIFIFVSGSTIDMSRLGGFYLRIISLSLSLIFLANKEVMAQETAVVWAES